jgi:thiamine-phosphate pyrophosphorylase
VEAPAPPRVLAISGALSGPADATFAAWLDLLAAAGVDAVQLRDRELDDDALYRLARRARERLPPSCRVLVNRRLDLALAAGADGVHLPAAGLPVAPLRRRFGAGVLIGCSTHHPDEVAAARRGGADYAVFGPVYSTPGKAAFGPPPGLAGLARATALGLPVLALGGVTAARLGALAAAGAAGVAGIRAFTTFESAAEVVRRAAALFAGQGPGL